MMKKGEKIMGVKAMVSVAVSAMLIFSMGFVRAEKDFMPTIKEFFPKADRVENVPVEGSLYMTEYLRVYSGKTLLGYVANVTALGVQDIEMVIGVSPQFTLVGCKVVEQYETPLIGGRLLNSKAFWDYLKSLDSKGWDTLSMRDLSAKVDEVTGATITTSGVVTAIQSAIKEIAASQGK
jgi:Na+-translocating ferredoxin:NAD+ oxidoreductase RnfG subunit